MSRGPFRSVLAGAVLALPPVTSAQAPTIDAGEARAHLGQTATVCGVVTSTRFDKTRITLPTFLYVDQPDSQFAVQILGADRGNFSEPPEVGYRGKRICVSGLIVSRGGGAAQILVDNPRAIRIETTIRRRDVDSGPGALLRLERPRQLLQPSAVALSRDGRWAAAGDAKGRFAVWDVDARQVMHVQAAMNSPPRLLTFSWDASGLAATGVDSLVRAWGHGSQGRAWSAGLGFPSGPVDATSLALSPDGRWLAVGNSGGGLSVYGVARVGPTRTERAFPEQEVGRWLEREYTGHLVSDIWHDLESYRSVTGLAFSHDGRQLAATTWAGVVTLWTLPEQGWDVRYDRALLVWDGFLKGAAALAWSPDGRSLAGIGRSHLELWNVQGKNRAWKVDIDGLGAGAVLKIAFSPDGRSMAVTDGYNLRLWDAATGRERWRVATGLSAAHTGSEADLAFTSDGSFVLVVDEFLRLGRWDAATGAAVPWR